jgi:23S rRNA (cytidine2498-2'-O)-methyltransferase
VSGEEAMVGLSEPRNASPWNSGIPRLKLPRSAPSRSVLKLEEALGLFLDDAERAAWLRPGRRAVDLGAAPGGWSWLLLERGLAVEAVDNARLAEVVRAHPRLRHWRVDGFGFQPSHAVDWLVCDMVERPDRVAALARDWLLRGHCRHVVLNLKLPMKRRWQSVRAHLETLRSGLPRHGRLAARQLYHDREEITVFASREPLAGR